MSTTRRSIRLDWTGEGLQFRGGAVDSSAPPTIFDPEKERGPSPMDSVLLACGSCAGADVVSILKKMKVELESCTVDVSGDRRQEHPKRYTSIKYRFRCVGKGLDRAKAERAVMLSMEKYCSVVHSLNPDIEVEHEIELA